MEKTKKANSIRKLLTLMLAFVMVFTGMGIGSWGVDAAWADTTDITFTYDGISDGCYDNVIPCNDITIGATAITKLYIVNVDINNVFRVGNLTGSYVLPAHILKINGEKLGSRFSGNTYYTAENPQVSSALTNETELKSRLGEKFFNENCIAGLSQYYFWGFIGTKFTTKYGLLVQITGQAQVDRTEIDKLIATIWDGEKYTDSFYKESDRYNGTVSMERDNKNPTDGFWYELTKTGGALETAKGIFVKQEECDAAYKNLQAAIANLIPSSQLNTTYLYETIKARGKYSEEYLETATAPSAAAYRKALKEAKDYLASLFDESKISTENPNGATAENVAANQDKADNYADALKNVQFVFQEDVSNAKINLQTIQALARQYNETENNGAYTEASWNAFVSASEAAVDYTKAHAVSESMNNEEIKQYAELARAFQTAAYNLTSERNTIQVTFSYTDDFHLRRPDITGPVKSWTNDPESNQVQKQTLELTSGATLADLWKQTSCEPGDSYLGSTISCYSIW